ncbi:hypothetical protein LWI28_018520 [Acer negundo]|uniref:Uncharacterized protein n=1 Tax=Acer negundo TaxID=4023 RepID=A0AAD5NW32_ACENE|nr:hypothetical protein LWI28_018520 [Acer negundo]KAK4851114.1 hypothetical protein QYF36_012518 [Acer negundo]
MKSLVKKQTEDRDPRVIIKEVLSFTLTEKDTFVREIMVQEFAKGLDALGLATLASFTSAVATGIPFASSSDTKEGKASMGNLKRVAHMQLVFYQLASVQDTLPILSVIHELPLEVQQQLLLLPGDLLEG